MNKLRQDVNQDLDKKLVENNKALLESIQEMMNRNKWYFRFRSLFFAFIVRESTFYLFFLYRQRLDTLNVTRQPIWIAFLFFLYFLSSVVRFRRLMLFPYFSFIVIDGFISHSLPYFSLTRQQLFDVYRQRTFFHRFYLFPLSSTFFFFYSFFRYRQRRDILNVTRQPTWK